MKRCPDCQEAKPDEDFPRNRNTKDGLATYCKACHRRRVKESTMRNGGSRRYHLRARYGLEPEAIEQLIAMQEGLCRICEQRPAVAMDHNHETGDVRGILCNPCNRAIGVFSDNPEWMERAAAYLRAEPLAKCGDTSYLLRTDRGGQ